MNLAQFAQKLDAQVRNVKGPEYEDGKARALGKYWPMKEFGPAKPLTLRSFQEGWSKLTKSM